MKYDDIILMDDPQAYWPLTETTGDFIDRTGNGYDAAVFGTLTRGSTHKTVAGEGGVAVGSNWDGYAICKKGMPWFGVTPRTIELWFAPTYTAGQWINYGNYSQMFAVPGHMGPRNGRYFTAGGFALNGQYYGQSLELCTERGYSPYLSYGSANKRDDKAYTPYEPSHTIYDLGAWTASGGLKYVVVRVAQNPVQGGSSTRMDFFEIFVNGSRVNLQGGPELGRMRGYHKYGPGFFGFPTSLSTAVDRLRYTWMAKAAMYDYALSDAQILRHYQAGVGTLAGNRVAGTTLLDGTATGGFPVFVHRRDTGELIGRTVSDGSGYFTCNVGSYGGLVYAVAFDPVSGKSYPAQVYDLITPSL